MKILLTIAWRNIWRNPGRSGALLAAIIIGLWAGVVTVGLMNAMLQQRMDYMIESEITHAQIHHPDFRDDGSANMYIQHHAEIIKWLEENNHVRHFTSRTITDGMLQSPVKTSGVNIRGIDVKTEPKTTNFHENLVEGEYLDTEMNFPVLLGKSLAEEHNMEIGDRIVLTFERTDNELTSAAFNITGFYKSASSQYDDRVVFVKNEDLSALLHEEPIYHEIAIMLNDVEYAGETADAINAKFSQVVAKTWSQISPELGTLAALGGLMLMIVTIIIMVALAFGILNTMLMALFERIREIGMLISIGMSRLRVFLMIMLESIILTLTGSIVGIFLAWLSILYLNEAGVNLEIFAGGIEEIGWPTVIFPYISLEEFILIVIIVVVITILASVYPAFKAFRTNPMEIEKV